jgi:multiple sugar transport system permease protein
MAKVARALVATVMALVWLVPLYLLLVNAFASDSAFSVDDLWAPSGFSFFTNLTTAWQTAGFGTTNILNTILYSVAAPAVAVIIAALAGFAVIVLRPRFASIWFFVIFGGTILPLQMLAAPLFLAYGRSQLYDTQAGMLLVYTAVTIPFATFVMRNVFGEIPRSIYEAALLDGSSRIMLFWRIYVPLSRSALVAVFVLQFTFVWNDLFLGLSLGTSTGAQGVTPALSGLESSYGGASYPVVLAGALGVTIPTVVVFLFTRRFFAAGLAGGSSRIRL